MSTITDTNRPDATVFAVLFGVATCHMLNDTMQALLVSMYPMLANSFTLTFTQIGLITLVFQVTASILQPLIGQYTDKRPLPWSLPVAPALTLLGLVLLGYAPSYAIVLIAAGLIGIGSAIFHPEASRVARAASGGRFGMAQSLFQVGGNFGTAIGPLLAAAIVIPHGQQSVVWFAALALASVLILARVSAWYADHMVTRRARPKLVADHGLSDARVAITIGVLLVLMFSKFVYTSSFHSYYAFYLIDRFHLSVQQAQLCLFAYLGAFAVGTFAGGPIGDAIGRKAVIWVSILGALPFTLALPYVNLPMTIVLSIIIGLVISSAFSAMVVFAQELMPNRVGMIAGLFFGFAFGIAGLGAAVLGVVADATSITYVFKICAFLPALGIMAIFLPRMPRG